MNLDAKMQKKRDFLKNKQFRAMVSIDDQKNELCKLNWAFQRTHYWIPTIQMAEIRHLENRHDVIFSAEGGPTGIKFRRLVQNDMSTAVMCGNGNHM